jgi:hypothetical protein
MNLRWQMWRGIKNYVIFMIVASAIIGIVSYLYCLITDIIEGNPFRVDPQKCDQRKNPSRI